MRVGFAFWCHWGDTILDRPSNIDEFTISCIINYLGIKHDAEMFSFYNPAYNPIFTEWKAAFRREAFEQLIFCDSHFEYPDLDILLLRWRWPVYGNTNDERLEIQNRVLKHYLGSGTNIFIWDDDFQMSKKEKDYLMKYSNVSFIEVSEEKRLNQKRRDFYVPYPYDLEQLKPIVLNGPGNAHGDHLDPTLIMSYIGNNYEREEMIDLYLKYAGTSYHKKIHFFGNWLKYDTRCMGRFHYISFHPKVNKDMMHWIYKHSYCVPMLAKENYLRLGHITPRMFEVLDAGTIPIGLKQFKNAGRYFNYIVGDGAEMKVTLDMIMEMSHEERINEINRQINLLKQNKIFSTEDFVNRLLGDINVIG